ncbi:VanZ family protein [Halorubrum sp. SP3]|uniref:VanZ family protein n=1 Tax=unclassified Halorubrum TaxID=2642239 RepID=UPI0010F87C14|nr:MULTISPECIES: VanZ family protein [unclassified Halorubrum]TKX55844.1 VanZ family protein [Halorubrum sp. SP3]TKX71374.1 VanZ family protein [Halorubrum sp. SP9]
MSDPNGRSRPTRRDREIRRDRARALAVSLALFVGSVVPVPLESPGGGGGAFDRILDALPAGVGLTDPFHLVGYAVLAALLVPVTRGRRLAGVLAVVGAVAFGFGIELVQAPIPWRSFAWRDAGVNAVGAVGGGVIAVVRRSVSSTNDRDGDR